MDGRRVYGLDIETDTSGGVDPAVGAIRTVALSTVHSESLYRGSELQILTALDHALAALEPGVIATWNGGAFDLPYLADRSAMLGIRLGLSLAADPRLKVSGRPLPGHQGAYRAAWYEHRHIDASRLYRSGRRPLMEVGELLTNLGIRRHPSRRERGGPQNDLAHEVIHAFAANDARLARALVERRRAAATRHVDRILRSPSVSSAPAPVSDVRVLRGSRPPLSPAHPAVRAMLAAQR